MWGMMFSSAWHDYRLVEVGVVAAVAGDSDDTTSTSNQQKLNPLTIHKARGFSYFHHFDVRANEIGLSTAQIRGIEFLEDVAVNRSKGLLQVDPSSVISPEEVSEVRKDELERERELLVQDFGSRVVDQTFGKNGVTMIAPTSGGRAASHTMTIRKGTRVALPEAYRVVTWEKTWKVTKTRNGQPVSTHFEDHQYVRLMEEDSLGIMGKLYDTAPSGSAPPSLSAEGEAKFMARAQRVQMLGRVNLFPDGDSSFIAQGV